MPEICEKTAKNSCFFDGRVLEYAIVIDVNEEWTAKKSTLSF